MKKGIKVLIFVMLVIPCIVFADTVNHDNAINEANNYILRENFQNKNNYILFDNPPYIMNDNGSNSYNSKYANGGLLNKKEYDYTLKNGNSWLIIPNKFWLDTMNTLNNKYYYLSSNGLQVDEPSEQHDVRVTEFVRPNTQVRGEGTISNPWEFMDIYFARFITSDINKAYFYNGTEVDNNHLSDRKASTEIMIKNGTVTVDINVKKGYANDPSDGCGLVKISETAYDNTNKIKYEVRNLTRDYNCTVRFIKETYTISYVVNNGTNSTTNKTTYDVETPDFTLVNPTANNGYDFAGWTGSNGDTPQKDITIKKGSTGNRSYTARINAIEYTIAYTINNGVNNSNNKTKYTVETATFSLSAPTMNQGYSFTGWTGTGLSGKTTSVSIPQGSTGDRSYTATADACQAGSYWANGQCLTCPKGYYCGGGVAGRTACAVGYYNDVTGSSSSSACKKCPACKSTASAGSASCSWNTALSANYNSTSGGYNGKIGIAHNGSCITDIKTFWGKFESTSWVSSGNYGFEDWLSGGNHGNCSSSPLKTYGFERYILSVGGKQEFTSGACNYAPVYNHIYSSPKNNGTKLSSGNRQYGFAAISGEKTVYFQIRNGGEASSVTVKNIKFKVGSSYYTIKQLVDNGYVYPLVLYGAFAVGNYSVALNLYNGGSQGNGFYPDTFVLMTVKSGVTIDGFSADQSVNSRGGDGFYIRVIDPNYFRVVLK